MFIKNRYLYSVFLVLLQPALIAQEMTLVQQVYIDQVIETLSEETENPEDIAIVFDDLLDYLQDPLNLNTASAAELAELHVLNDFQIVALFDYRETHGDLLSIYELLYIPGYRQEDIDLIKAFVDCKDSERENNGFKGSDVLVKQQVILRYQRILEKQEGYIPIADSVLAENPDVSHYLGGPDKFYCRYKMDWNNKLQAGILMEKDAGEEFFKGSNRTGFDFYSGYIGYKSTKGLIRQLILGDYHIQMGQGLLTWSSYSSGMSSCVSDLCRKRELIRTNSSAEENRFFRGSSIAVGDGHVMFTAFASMHRIDALVESDTSLQEVVTGIITTGSHSTPSDLEKENSLKLSSAGANLSYTRDRLKLGINSVASWFDKYMEEKDKLYEQYSFSGNTLYGVSADYSYLGRSARLFGEIACSNGAVAVINGMLVYLKPGLNLGILHRHYDKAYYSFLSEAFGENTMVANEDGFFLGLGGGFTGNRFRLYSDIFSFPWLRYRVNTPSEGYEVFGEWERSLGITSIYIRYKRQEKPVNCAIDRNLYEVLPQIREQFRLSSTISVGPLITLQNRIELSRAGFRGDTFQTGFLISQDVLFGSLLVPIDISMRIAYFNTEDYNTRIYAYERDLLYAATSQMYYGKGWRYMLLLKWQPLQNISFWCKIGQTRYPGEETISSGLSEIQGNHRTEVKVQMILNL